MRRFASSASHCGKGVKLCRPSEVILDLLEKWPPGPFAKEDGELILDSDGQRVS